MRKKMFDISKQNLKSKIDKTITCKNGTNNETPNVQVQQTEAEAELVQIEEAEENEEAEEEDPILVLL